MVINGSMVNRSGLALRMRESSATEMPVRSRARRTVQGRSSRNPEDLDGRYRLKHKSGNYSHKDTKNTKEKGVGPITAWVNSSTYISG